VGRAISALGLSQAWAWRIAAKVIMGLSKFDTLFEHQAQEHHFNVYGELGFLLYQPTGFPAPRKQRCSICRQSYFKLYLVHRKESHAATSTASTRCAVEAASLPASQPPLESPSKKKKDDRHRDYNHIHTRLAAAFVAHFDTLSGIPICYGCYAGTTENVMSQGKELVLSILCDLISAFFPQYLPERLQRSASLPASPPSK